MVFLPLLFFKNKSIVKGEDGGMYELGVAIRVRVSGSCRVKS